jgi:hypothetical protein
MRRISLLCTLVLLAASSAGAATVNLRWSNCWGDGGVMNRTFACNTNSGTENLVGSFVMPHDLSQVSGEEIVLDIAVAGATLPAWWEFKNTGTCRQGSLGINFVQPATSTNCTDWAGGGAVGGIGSYANFYAFSPNSVRLRAVSAVPLSALADLSQGVEYYSFTVTIGHQKTVGTGACAGCSLGACLSLKGIGLTTPTPANNLSLRAGVNPGEIYDDALATWQGGAGVISQGVFATDCPAATPTRNRTWSDVKAIYR